MKKTTLILIVVLLAGILNGSFAQYTKEDEKKNSNPLSELSFKDRIFTGGNLGFNIFQNYLFLDLAPIVGYRITEKLGAGVGLRYSLIRNLSSKTNWSNYGGSVFMRYKIIPQLFLHTEFEALRSYNYDISSPNYGDRAMAYMWFAGGGYSTGSGAGVNFSLMLLYDFIDHVNSPYQNAYLFGPSGIPLIFRGGVSVGF
ncbi:MAG: hypothetical protein H6599_10725 [Flavobacteriales bacterium]|nr:hypothetical protein [Flavobacteriales bacterium]